MITDSELKRRMWKYFMSEFLPENKEWRKLCTNAHSKNDSTQVRVGKWFKNELRPYAPMAYKDVPIEIKFLAHQADVPIPRLSWSIFNSYPPSQVYTDFELFIKNHKYFLSWFCRPEHNYNISMHNLIREFCKIEMSVFLEKTREMREAGIRKQKLRSCEKLSKRVLKGEIDTLIRRANLDHGLEGGDLYSHTVTALGGTK